VIFYHSGIIPLRQIYRPTARNHKPWFEISQ